jgi:hypothetical protein
MHESEGLNGAHLISILLYLYMADGEKHRHCGVITSGTKNMTTVNGEVTLQFHSNAEDRLAAPASAVMVAPEAETSGAHPYKGFWVHFEGDILVLLTAD